MKYELVIKDLHETDCINLIKICELLDDEDDVWDDTEILKAFLYILNVFDMYVHPSEITILIKEFIEKLGKYLRDNQ